jgi:preprotein translocase subunit SecE
LRLRWPQRHRRSREAVTVVEVTMVAALTSAAVDSVAAAWEPVLRLA